MKNINKYILDFAREIYPELVKIRRRIHEHPETGFKEFKTSSLIKKLLKQIGLDEIMPCAGTGVVGLLRGARPGKTIALRADMDALPVKEETGFSFSSKNEGVMHACGHDGHVACLIGAACILKSLKNELPGNVKFIFQPAEEGPGGALPMIKDGALKSPKVDAAFALHIFPGLKTGAVMLKEGVISAFADEIEITVLGKSGHAAYPSEAVDTILISAEILTGLRDIVKKFNNHPDAMVITIGKIAGGTKHNIIAGETQLFGTVRTLSALTRQKVHAEINKTVAAVTKKYGARFVIVRNEGYPTTVNDKKTTQIAARSLKDLLGNKNVIYLPEATLGGEDFAYFSLKVPSVFIKLSAGTKGKSPRLHNNKFYFDENILKTGAAIHAKVAWEFLNREQKTENR